MVSNIMQRWVVELTYNGEQGWLYRDKNGEFTFVRSLLDATQYKARVDAAIDRLYCQPEFDARIVNLMDSPSRI